MSDDDIPLPQADSVSWMGLCPCGCGAFKAVLLDENDKGIAVFGWDAEGWALFMAGVMRQIKEESNGRKEEEAGEGPFHDHKTH